MVIILSALMAITGQPAMYYDVAEWKAHDYESALVLLAKCDDIVQTSNTIMQCELIAN